MPSVSSARLNLTTGKLSVAFERGRDDAGAVLERLDGLGYPATPFDPAKDIVPVATVMYSTPSTGSLSG